jgi:hypothetical protein
MAAQLRVAACAAKFTEFQACEIGSTMEKNAAWEQNGYSFQEPLFETYESLHHPLRCSSLEPVPDEVPEEVGMKGTTEFPSGSENTSFVSSPGEDTGDSSDGASENLSGKEIMIRAPWRRMVCR